MEYIYAALLLHKLGKPVNENNITQVLQSTGAGVDESRVKSLVASLKDVDIDSELANAVVATAVPASGHSASKEAEEKPKEERKEAAAEGLSALFG